MAVSLTTMQLQLLRFIAGYQAAHGGVSPTLRECGIAIGRKRKSTIFRLLTRMEERGAIRRQAGLRRAIEVIHVPPIPLIDGVPLYAVPLVTTRGPAFSGERL